MKVKNQYLCTAIRKNLLKSLFCVSCNAKGFCVDTTCTINYWTQIEKDQLLNCCCQWQNSGLQQKQDQAFKEAMRAKWVVGVRTTQPAALALEYSEPAAQPAAAKQYLLPVVTHAAFHCRAVI